MEKKQTIGGLPRGSRGGADGELFKRARKVIPGGVNSPVRAFRGVGGAPLFVSGGRGAKVFACDGRKLTDYCCSWGAMILGHGRREVAAAAADAARGGSTFGIATALEVEFAERLCGLVRGLEQVRAVSSGTEAVMTAVRLARGVTGRARIVKFDGCYHGHSDALLVKSGSGLLACGGASSAGVTPGAAADTLVLPYNDLAAAERLFASAGDEIAAVIVEPVAGNMGLVPPRPGFLKGLRALTRAHGALLVCDEVIDGFRFAFGTYSDRVAGVTPDLYTLGKVIGGGLPLAAVGGRRKWMRHLAPEGDVYQAGTLAGNPVAVAAGLKTLEILQRENPYPRMAALGARLVDGVNEQARRRGLPFRAQGLGGVFTLFCSPEPVTDLASAKKCDAALYARLFHALYAQGVYVAPSQFECNFISAAHGERDVEAFLAAFARGLNG